MLARSLLLTLLIASLANAAPRRVKRSSHFNLEVSGCDEESLEPHKEVMECSMCDCLSVGDLHELQCITPACVYDIMSCPDGLVKTYLPGDCCPSCVEPDSATVPEK